MIIELENTVSETRFYQPYRGEIIKNQRHIDCHGHPITIKKITSIHDN